MTPETEAIGYVALTTLGTLVTASEQDTVEVIGHNSIPEAVVHFNAYRELVRSLQERMAALQKHLDTLSYELLPTMFVNQDVKSIRVDDVGIVTIKVRWNAKMLNKAQAFDWLRSTGNEGLIIETVNAQTLGAFARVQTENGKPLPSDIFQVSSAPHVSINAE
jgi:phosphoribosyl-dephospho-CoA transferase